MGWVCGRSPLITSLPSAPPPNSNHQPTVCPPFTPAGKAAIASVAAPAGQRPTWVREEAATGFAQLAANFPALVQVRAG